MFLLSRINLLIFFAKKSFEISTIGAVWVSEFGNKTVEYVFENLLKYSPLHTVRKPTSEKEQYPATFIITGDNDHRVSPWHSLKYAAELNYNLKDNQFQKNPILLQVYENTGHGAGISMLKSIEQSTDILTFVHRAFNADAEITSGKLSAPLKDGFKGKKK